MNERTFLLSSDKIHGGLGKDHQRSWELIAKQPEVQGIVLLVDASILLRLSGKDYDGVGAVEEAIAAPLIILPDAVEVRETVEKGFGGDRDFAHRERRASAEAKMRTSAASIRVGRIDTMCLDGGQSHVDCEEMEAFATR